MRQFSHLSACKCEIIYNKILSCWESTSVHFSCNSARTKARYDIWIRRWVGETLSHSSKVWKVNKRSRTYLECHLLWSQLRRQTVCHTKLLNCTAATGSKLDFFIQVCMGWGLVLCEGEPAAVSRSPHNFSIILAVWGLASENRLKPSSLSWCNMPGNLASPSEDVKEKIYTTVVSGRPAARFTWVVVMDSNICVQDTVNNRSQRTSRKGAYMTRKLTKSSFKLITLLLESPWQLMPTLWKWLAAAGFNLQKLKVEEYLGGDGSHKLLAAD